MDAAQFERELRRLRAHADDEIGRLTDERARVHRLIELVSKPEPRSARARGKRPSQPDPRRAPLLDLIRERPGIRTSMLGMVTGRSSEDVAVEIADQESRGAVERFGLGWRATS